MEIKTFFGFTSIIIELVLLGSKYWIRKNLLVFVKKKSIICSSKNYLKREQINKTEKETVFRKNFLKGL